MQQGGFFPGDRGKSDPNGHPSDISIQHLLEISVVAWVVFSCVCLLFGLSYHNSKVEIWTVVVLGIIVLLAVVYQSWHTWYESHMSRTSIIVATWLLVAVVTGSWVGLYSYECCISEYWMAHELEARTNVLPSEAAGAYSNAGAIVFADEARVDPSRSVGFKDNAVYCVAPVASDAALDTVQFWAAGTDCCGARGSFHCDDAWNPKARSGLVILPKPDNSIIHEDVREQYMKAVRLAEVTYAIASAKEPIFVRWVSDPAQVELNIWRAGMGIVIAAIVIASLVCGLQAFAVHTVLRSRYK